MDYNKSFFANKPVDSWLIPNRNTGKKYLVELMDNGEYRCACHSKSTCQHIRDAIEWQENEKKGY